MSMQSQFFGKDCFGLFTGVVVLYKVAIKN
jgi:hypothetical protein